MKSLLAAVLLAASSAAFAQPVVPVPVPVTMDAKELGYEAARLALRLGYSDDVTLEPDAAKVAEIAAALAAVRALDPAAAAYNLKFMGPPDTALMIGYADSLRPALDAAAAGLSADARGLKRPAALGIAALDSVATRFSAGYELMDGYGALYLRLRFPRAVDLQKAGKLLSAVPGVTYAQADGLIGGPGYPVLVDSDGAGGWRVSTHRGWGDCMAGCINNEYWYYSVSGRLAVSAGHYRRVYDSRANRMVETGAKLW